MGKRPRLRLGALFCALSERASTLDRVGTLACGSEHNDDHVNHWASPVVPA